VQLWKIAVDTVHVWKFKEGMLNVGASQDLLVKYAMKLDALKAISITCNWTNVNLAQGATRIQ